MQIFNLFTPFPAQPPGRPEELARMLRYQPPFRTVRARITVALVVFVKTPINHLFFKSF